MIVYDNIYLDSRGVNMEVDVVILIILLVAGICYFRKLDSSVYYIASVDIFFRILTFIRDNLKVEEISKFIAKYFPESIPSIIYKYTDGVLSDILVWLYVIMFGIFLFYTVKILWKKR